MQRIGSNRIKYIVCFKFFLLHLIVNSHASSQWPTTSSSRDLIHINFLMYTCVHFINFSSVMWNLRNVPSSVERLLQFCMTCVYSWLNVKIPASCIKWTLNIRKLWYLYKTVYTRAEKVDSVNKVGKLKSCDIRYRSLTSFCNRRQRIILR